MNNIENLLKSAVKATSSIKHLDAEKKSDILHDLANEVLKETSTIIRTNKKDFDKMDDFDPKKDRLLLNKERIEDIVSSIIEVSKLADPTDKLLSEVVSEKGLLIQKKTVPLGVIGVIYESRPNVTLDVAALCIRSGNVCLLRGGSDAINTNTLLVKIIRKVLTDHEIDPNIIQLLPVNRDYVDELLSAQQYVDIIIPRGSQILIDYVRRNSKIPVIETGAGVCHTFIENTADLEMAAKIVTNAKITKPSACNSLDGIIVEEGIADTFLSFLAKEMASHKVEILADSHAYKTLVGLKYPYLQRANHEDFGIEFLSLRCTIKVVKDINHALYHISEFSSKHSEAIISNDLEKIDHFMNEVDAAVVFSNASTRFTDGQVFGLGAEIGISTQKLHARGPFALEKLVTEKWFVRGNGQVRI
ncbi:glutamate-5-semialdehyde dehydrogenase [Sphingobacterium siyangense]|uniref:Gamma-glutamyl phosphate reductase n=1 Tax=Sphingobacterium siyangense TaxID=459529 RepID=A0A562LZH7_9SPHI|nr:glutamate-5-semialdehyde dehydrogenase [Sphingobacterium siyangense]TWI13077.1 glutamate-5-semialdehyde dehydrogenase [Sphingobacterium siyangense]